MKSALIVHDFSFRLLRDDYSHPTRLQTRNDNDEIPRTTLVGLCEAKARMCTHRIRRTHYLDLPQVHWEITKDEISKKETDAYAKIPQQNEDIYKQINQETHETKACNIHTLGRTQLIPRPVYRFSVFFWPSQSQLWN